MKKKEEEEKIKKRKIFSSSWNLFRQLRATSDTNCDTKKQTFSFTLLPAILSLIVKIIRKRKISLWWHTSDKTNSSCVYSKTNFQTIAYDRSSTKLDSTQHNTIQYIYIYIFSSQFTTLENQSKERTSPSFSLSIPRTIPPKNPPSFNLSSPFTIIHRIKSPSLSLVPILSPSMPASSRRVGRAMESLVPTRRRGTTFNQKLPAASLPVSAPYGLASAPSLPDTKERPAPGGGPGINAWGAFGRPPRNELLARVSPPILYRRGEKTETGKSPGLDANNPETNLPPFNPLLGRSLASAQLRLSRRFRSRSLHLSFFVGGFRGGGWISRSQDSLLTRQTEGESSRRRELRHSLRVDSKTWF